MTTLNSAIGGLASWSKNLEARMRRVSLGLTVYLIWEERNKRIFDSTYNLVDVIFRKFQVLFYIVLHFHEKKPFPYQCWMMLEGLTCWQSSFV